MPAAIQTTMTISGDPTLQVITRAFRKTPVPMTLPMTMEAAATNVRPRMSVMLLGASFDMSLCCQDHSDYQLHGRAIKIIVSTACLRWAGRANTYPPGL